MPEQEYKPLETASAARPIWQKILIGLLVLCVVLFAVVYFGLVYYLTGVAKAEMVTLNEQKAMEFCNPGLELGMEEMVYNTWWPGCGYVSSMSNFSGGCGGDCYDAQFMKDMQSFNEQFPSKKVFYPSRVHDGVEDVQLGGWWLPGDHSQLPEGATAPRIVVQHGFKSNSNMFRTQLFAYVLRSLGFDILLNNLRDHCFSENSTSHIYEWGHAYPLDLLGAWDYAVNDPDNELGGKANSSQVGVLGFSMGGFLTNIVFRMEGEIPAVWVDAPPFVPSTVFSHGLQKILGGLGLGFMTDLVMPWVWSNTLGAAMAYNVDLEKHLPQDTLPQGPDTARPIYLVLNKQDGTIPSTEGDSLVALLEKHPSKYSFKGRYEPDGVCVDIDHCVDHLKSYKGYKAKLCEFWTSVFGVDSKACKDSEPSSEIQ